ncbi:MAG: nucleotidyl transferase AbiEii/AbiGii toxin family protein [Candidatus Bathyarchaeota archaeon]|nr:MAG: nucleotidyl transferase AbiEii/AbiGii toxin family protein [Candidatus Bathyarchaeota archaeon]
MRKDFVNQVSRIQKIKRVDMIEKDLILHQILSDLSNDKFFSENFVFKGGTCLIKHYLGYYRFSEDIDFTWKNQTILQGKSQKEIRRTLSKIIDNLGELFEKISAKRDLNFKCAKNNTKFVELGGGNKFCTFKIWYTSEVLDRESFMKVQINFVEKLLLTSKKAELKSLLTEQNEELLLMFPEYEDYLHKITVDVYDIKEIFCEKIRSILTRQGTKARDFLDVYLISKRYRIDIEEMIDSIVCKTKFMLELYKKYRKNFENKKELGTFPLFRWGEEKELLLQYIDEKDFFQFLEKLKLTLQKIIQKIAEKASE